MPSQWRLRLAVRRSVSPLPYEFGEAVARTRRASSLVAPKPQSSSICLSTLPIASFLVWICFTFLFHKLCF